MLRAAGSGAPTRAAADADPFTGKMPWELTSKADLEVPRQLVPPAPSDATASAPPASAPRFAAGRGADLLRFAGVSWLRGAVPRARAEAARAAADARASELALMMSDLDVDPASPFRYAEVRRRADGVSLKEVAFST